jgi:CRISPR type I-D-associated protein Csc3/Cas10d
MEKPLMSDTEAPLVELGRAAARIQKRPGFDASANVELLCFNLSLETAIGVWRLKQRDPESLTMAIAGELETNLARKQQISSAKNRPGEKLQDAFVAFARRFVDDVWFGVLNGRPPAQASRRVLAAIYRMSFLTAPLPKSDAKPETTTENAD